MRLGQLARKLEIKTTDIIDFLSEKGIDIETGTNTKLEEEQVSIIMSEFAPVEEETPAPEVIDEETNQDNPDETNTMPEHEVTPETETAEEITSETEAEAIIPQTAKEPDTPEMDAANVVLAEGTVTEASEETTTTVDEKPTETEAPTASESVTESAPEVENESLAAISTDEPLSETSTAAIIEESDTDEELAPSYSATDFPELELEEDAPELDVLNRESQDGVIRAPKVELDGLKVLGKIDLPSKKELEDEEQEASETIEQEEIANNAPLQKKTKLTKEEWKEKKLDRERKRLAAEKKVEEWRLNKSKALLDKQEKKQRKSHYENLVQQKKAAQKSAALSDQKKTPKKQKKKEEKPAPKTLFGKFLRWLNT